MITIFYFRPPPNISLNVHHCSCLLPEIVVGDTVVAGGVVDINGLAETGTISQLPFLNLKSSMAISPK